MGTLDKARKLAFRTPVAVSVLVASLMCVSCGGDGSADIGADTGTTVADAADTGGGSLDLQPADQLQDGAEDDGDGVMDGDAAPTSDATGDGTDAQADKTEDMDVEEDMEPGVCFSMENRSWEFHEVNAIGGAPIYPDITVGPAGLPIVAYRRGNLQQRYAVVSSFDGTQWTTPEPVDYQSGRFLGKRPSIAADAGGGIYVAAYDEDDWRLRLAHRQAGGDWSVETLYEADMDAGDHSCLFLDGSGRLHLTFTEYTHYRIIYGRREGGSWLFSPIGAGAEAIRGASSSLVTDQQGQAHVGIYTGKHLQYAVGSEDGWTVEVVDDSSDSMGHYPNIALDALGRPRIVYLKWPEEISEVRLAVRGTDGWSTEVVDGGLGITYTTGIGVLPCGTTVIAYARNEGGGEGGLWFGYRNPGDTGWTLVSVDDSTYVAGIDLAVDPAGRIHIVYMDETNYVLRHVCL